MEEWTYLTDNRRHLLAHFTTIHIKKTPWHTSVMKRLLVSMVNYDLKYLKRSLEEVRDAIDEVDCPSFSRS